MIEIEKKFPSIFDKVYDYMIDYQDEDMTQRKQFVANIPFLRGLNRETITRVVFLMKQKVYDLGDLVLKQGQNNEKIMILWEGTI